MERDFLRELGISEDAVEKIMMENGKDITAEGKKRNQKLIDERDDFKIRLAAAETTLNRFEGIDPEKINQELADWKKKAEDAEKNYNAQLTQRDQRDWLKARMDEYGVKSPYARKQLEQECMAADSGLAWKDNKFMGFDDFMKSAKEKDASLYQTQAEKAAAEEAAKLQANAPKFTGPAGDAGGKSERYVPPKIF